MLRRAVHHVQRDASHVPPKQAMRRGEPSRLFLPTTHISVHVRPGWVCTTAKPTSRFEFMNLCFLSTFSWRCKARRARARLYLVLLDSLHVCTMADVDDAAAVYTATRSLAGCNPSRTQRQRQAATERERPGSRRGRSLSRSRSISRQYASGMRRSVRWITMDGVGSTGWRVTWPTGSGTAAQRLTKGGPAQSVFTAQSDACGSVLVDGSQCLPAIYLRR